MAKAILSNFNSVEHCFIVNHRTFTTFYKETVIDEIGTKDIHLLSYSYYLYERFVLLWVLLKFPSISTTFRFHCVLTTYRFHRILITFPLYNILTTITTFLFLQSIPSYFIFVLRRLAQAATILTVSPMPLHCDIPWNVQVAKSTLLLLQNHFYADTSCTSFSIYTFKYIHWRDFQRFRESINFSFSHS